MGNLCSRRTTTRRQQPYLANGADKTRAPVSSSSSPATVPEEAGFPPLRPARKTKSRLIPDKDSYKSIENRANNTSSVPRPLASSLTRNCPDDLHKVRAIFCWIAANITYDVAAMNRNDIRGQEPDMVLRTKRAVCQGFSQLFKALCGHADVPCLMVSGLDKGLNYDPQTVFTAQSTVNHAWNLVFVQGEWRPLDVTWGSGHLDSSGRFQRAFTEHWFLTDPAEFVTDHFPLMDEDVKKSEKYQLLKRPVTLEQFSASVRLKPSAYALGLGASCLSHQQAVLRVRRDVTITLKAPPKGRGQPLETVRVTLAERGRRGGGGSVAGGGCSNVLTWLDVDGTCKIYIRPPRAGTFYELKVMGRGTGQTENTVSELLTYIIECTEAYPSEQQKPFPDKEEPWGLQRPQATQCGLRAVKGAPYSFRADRRGQVRVSVPLTEATTVLKAELTQAGPARAPSLERYAQVEPGTTTSTTGTITARLPFAGYYLLRVYAGQPSSSSSRNTTLKHCADYLLHSDRSHDAADEACAPFPEAFPYALEQKVSLLNPTRGRVPAGKKTLYRLRAPELGKVALGFGGVVKTTMVKKKGGGGGVWEGEITPAPGAKTVTMYGAVDADATSLNGLFEFEVV